MAPADYLWPEDMPMACPPAQASEGELTVYRFVKYSPPRPSDFERPIDKPRKNSSSPEELCELCALSVFASSGDIPIARQFIPGFSKRLVAEGRISVGDGLVAQSPTSVGTPPSVLESHHNWWVPIDVDPLPGFDVVDL